jgi:SnoaL-like domain
VTDISITRLRDAINSHDPARVAACFAPDYHCETPMHPSRDFVGSEHVFQNWTGILARIPDLRAEILRSAAAGPESWSEWEMRGTATDGSAALIRGVVVSVTRDSAIGWTRFYLDPVTDDQPAPGHPH